MFPNIQYIRGRQPLARVPQVAREKIFYGTPSDLTRMRNLLYKRARRNPNLKLSTLHEINSPKICQACNSLDNFYVGDVCCGSANDTHNWFAVKAKKLAQDNPVYAISHLHKQIRVNKDAIRRKNEKFWCRQA